MKPQSKSYVIPALLTPLLIATLFNGPVSCKRAESKPVVNECRFEGAECPNVQHYLRDYQIEVHFDTVWVYDADRLVSRFINTRWDSQLDTVIINDNL